MFFLKDDSVLEMINEGLRGLWANLCEFIYPKIAEMYSVFMDLSKLIYSDDLSAIYNKISLFLGIFMIFRLSFWLIEALMNPDILGDKAKAPGEMIKKVFLVVVLLGITPSIFKYAYKLQYEVVNSNVIGNIISDNKTAKTEPKKFGGLLSAELFSIFYRPNYDEAGNILNAENLDCSIYTGTSDNNYEGYYYTILKNSGDLKYLSENRCLREKVEVEFTDTKEKVDAFVVDFDGLYATAVGIFVFWMILMYCISLGTRYVQLIFLQVIAPIPIMGYLSTDKDNMFSKWVKQCTTTYLDVFIRIIIINFTVWLISMVLSGNSAIPSDLKKGGMITLFLVLGLLTFAKKAPELIQELLPKSVTKASGDFGLSWKKRTDAMLGGKAIYGTTTAVGKAGTVGLGIGALTALRGAAGGRGVGRLTGFVGGFARGVVNGGKKGTVGQNLKNSWQRQGQVNKQKIDWANSGSTWAGRMRQRFDNALGFVGTAEEYENRISAIDLENGERNTKVKRLKNIGTEVGNMENRAKSKLTEKGILSGYAGQLQQQRSNYGEIYKHLSSADFDGAKKIAKSEVERAKAHYDELKTKERNGTITDAERKQLVRAESSMIDAAAMYARLESQTFTSTDARQWENKINKQTAEDYISGVREGTISDEVIAKSTKEITESMKETASMFDLNLPADVLDQNEEFAKIKGMFKKDGDHYVLRSLDDFEAIDAVKGSAKALENDIQFEIDRAEREKMDIQASPGYKAAKADRDAVGGHSGKK